MSVYKIQMPGDYPEESIQHSEQGERKSIIKFQSLVVYLIMIQQVEVNTTVNKRRKISG